MHTALLYIAKKQLNMEERAGEVVPSPGGYAWMGGKKRVRYLGQVTSDLLDLLDLPIKNGRSSSLAKKALDREFCFGRKKKKKRGTIP